jgi:hypothetical protein
MRKFLQTQPDIYEYCSHCQFGNLKAIKLIEGKQYIIKQDNWNSDLKVTYAGIVKDSNYTCDICKKQRWNTYCFIYGKVDNPTNQYFYGSECIKKLQIDIGNECR